MWMQRYLNMTWTNYQLAKNWVLPFSLWEMIGMAQTNGKYEEDFANEGIKFIISLTQKASPQL